ncbi:uncharacterized protein EDB91DRAFT_1089033 [Suillus paluster]|uniref:uncharacterized protein n=1 Tax=Suillus paluster TaxID=48578 RepID=UPI001B87FEF4|nr:uncharacterized protein EDB91DRAFT_1089033 [Suillus paluster]KAG1719952.1 hypothetical protein EDB91DRAFT_1089033 [Suillus paluster]
MSFLVLFNKSAQPLRYKLLARLTAYNGSIHALGISNDGHLLACGGIKGNSQLRNLGHYYENHGRNPLLWNRPGLYLPKSVVFAENQSIYVFGLYDGNFMKLKDEDGDIVQEISCKSVMRETTALDLGALLTLYSGHAAVYSKQGIFIVDNTTDGFTLYCLEGDGEPVQMLATGLPSMLVLKQVAFGEEGQILETLHHTDTGLVQTTSTPNLNGCCTIASTLPMPGCGKTTIKIWVYDYAVPKVSKAPSGDYWSLSHILVMLTRLLALLSMSVFLLINYRDSFLHVQAAIIFDEYVDIKKDDKEGLTEGYVKNDIMMLWELAVKLMELAREADGEINKDNIGASAILITLRAVKGGRT